MKPAKCFVLLATVPGLAVAQDCAEIEDDQERLACYDTLHEPVRVPAAEATPELEAATAPAPASEPGPEPEVVRAAPVERPAETDGSATPPDNFGLREKDDGPSHTLTARIERIQTAGNVDYLYLDNGQVWRETGGDSGVRFKEGKKVTISEGVLDSYDLTMEGRNRKTKVKRVR
jgi:hypothetical protein